MAVRTKIDPIAKTIDIIVDKTLSPEVRSRAAANFAREQINAADAKNTQVLGRPAPKTVTVDGQRGAPLESVNPDGGAIITEWNLLGEVLAWIGQTLRDRSPVLSGKYRDSHTLFADGVEVPIGEQVPEASEYVFTNLEPYARRIEVGKTRSGRDFVVSVPNRIYERTYRDAKSRVGNVARISFGYRAMTGAYQLRTDQRQRSWDKKRGGWRYRAKQARDRVAGSVVTAPAIIVTLKTR